jgi:hypothetical protein
VLFFGSVAPLSAFFLSERDIGDLCDLAEAWLKSEPYAPIPTQQARCAQTT